MAKATVDTLRPIVEELSDHLPDEPIALSGSRSTVPSMWRFQISQALTDRRTFLPFPFRRLSVGNALIVLTARCSARRSS